MRASGTEPLIRLMVEAEDKKICEEQISKILDAIKGAGLLA